MPNSIVTCQDIKPAVSEGLHTTLTLVEMLVLDVEARLYPRLLLVRSILWLPTG